MIKVTPAARCAVVTGLILAYCGSGSALAQDDYEGPPSPQPPPPTSWEDRPFNQRSPASTGRVDFHIIELSSERPEYSRPIGNLKLEYPPYELRRNQQGWVIVSFVVSADGSVVDPIVDDSSGSEAFEKATLKAVRNWQYEPTTWQGEAVGQWRSRQLVTFALEYSHILVGRKFFHRYGNINQSIDEGDFDAAKSLIDDTREEMDLNVFEVSRLWLARGRLAGEQGDLREQLRCFRKATIGKGRWIDATDYPKLQYAIVRLELQLGEYAPALRDYEELQQSRKGAKLAKNLEASVQSVRDLVGGNKTFAIAGSLAANANCEQCDAFWTYEPLRNTFSIDSMQGAIDHVETRCTFARQYFEFADTDTWTLPDDRGDCIIAVFGDAGTQFRLLEKAAAR
jgi:TonB family protein